MQKYKIAKVQIYTNLHNKDSTWQRGWKPHLDDEALKGSVSFAGKHSTLSSDELNTGGK